MTIIVRVLGKRIPLSAHSCTELSDLRQEVETLLEQQGMVGCGFKLFHAGRPLQGGRLQGLADPGTELDGCFDEARCISEEDAQGESALQAAEEKGMATIHSVRTMTQMCCRAGA
eukprot:TRINITY_DN37763_c0_g1_i1.p1 TRINITY_DN37763_c0_g1~~TRINITY_DN37763_c0_g1_i1.p1  ORF type:complete len:115 (+),score=26.10 TRINITY_DN37763_c0_g1_i1:173-517(+)